MPICNINRRVLYILFLFPEPFQQFGIQLSYKNTKLEIDGMSFHTAEPYSFNWRHRWYSWKTSKHHLNLNKGTIASEEVNKVKRFAKNLW